MRVQLIGVKTPRKELDVDGAGGEEALLLILFFLISMSYDIHN
jgi:hypothetical protein